MKILPEMILIIPHLFYYINKSKNQRVMYGRNNSLKTKK